MLLVFGLNHTHEVINYLKVLLKWDSSNLISYKSKTLCACVYNPQYMYVIRNSLTYYILYMHVEYMLVMWVREYYGSHMLKYIEWVELCRFWKKGVTLLQIFIDISLMNTPR